MSEMSFRLKTTFCLHISCIIVQRSLFVFAVLRAGAGSSTEQCVVARTAAAELRQQLAAELGLP